jgi:hypothetical protein
VSRATILPGPSPEILVTLLLFSYEEEAFPKLAALPKAVAEPSSGTLLTEIEREFQESRQIIALYGVLRSRSLPTMDYPFLTWFPLLRWCYFLAQDVARLARSPLDRDDYLVAAKVGNTHRTHGAHETMDLRFICPTPSKVR